MIELVIGLNQMISSGNFSATFAPVDDHLYPGQTKFFHDSPKSALQKGNFKKVLKCKKMLFAYRGFIESAIFHKQDSTGHGNGLKTTCS